MSPVEGELADCHCSEPLYSIPPQANLKCSFPLTFVNLRLTRCLVNSVAFDAMMRTMRMTPVYACELGLSPRMNGLKEQSQHKEKGIVRKETVELQSDVDDAFQYRSGPP
jgi:hypothetical protein